MAFEGKELSNITIGDIQFLIDNQIVEDVSIEYKSQCWKSNDSGTHELLKDISSFANAMGGHIVLGVEEDKQSDGVPKNIVGISDADKEIQRIMNVCLASIHEKIIGLDAVAIPYGANKHVVVIRIPRSNRVPHMIIFKHLYQCWRRHLRQKNVMSIDEIRDACIKVENIRRDLEGFIEERKAKVIEQSKGTPMLYVSATPLRVKDDIIDIFDAGLNKLLQNPPKTRTSGGVNVDCCDSYGGGWRPTLYGIKGERIGWRSMEILRNGHIEFLASEMVHEDKYKRGELIYQLLIDLWIVEYLVNFMMFLKKFYIYFSLFEPTVLCVALLNIKGIGLHECGVPQFIPHSNAPSIWTEENLILPPMQIPSVDDPHKTARVFADRIWNAFGFEKAYFFDENGKFFVK